MHHVRCAAAISKTGRKITVTIEKSKGVALVPVGAEYHSILRAKMPSLPFLTHLKLGCVAVDCCYQPDGRHDLGVISRACVDS